MGFIDDVIEAWKEFLGLDDDESRGGDEYCTGCPPPEPPVDPSRLDLDAWIDFEPGDLKIVNLEVNQIESAIIVEYSDGSKFSLPAATGSPEYAGADAAASAKVRDTFGSLTYDGFVNTRVPWSEKNDQNPYGPAYIRLAGPTDGRHIHGTSGPVNTELKNIGGSDPNERKFTHGCARLPNEAVLKLKKEIDQALSGGSDISVDFENE